jgi:hypothetical protein
MPHPRREANQYQYAVRFMNVVCEAIAPCAEQAATAEQLGRYPWRVPKSSVNGTTVIRSGGWLWPGDPLSLTMLQTWGMHLSHIRAHNTHNMSMHAFSLPSDPGV